MPTRYDHSALYNDQRVNTKTDILEDRPQRTARDLLIPQIAKLTRNAIQVTPVAFEYFQRLKVGRRCSCFTFEEEAQGLCLICYGTGIVGGWQKRGTKLVVLDVTSPSVRCVNVAPDWNRVTRPVNFTLLPTAVYGYLETEIEISNNIGVLDVLQVLHTKNTNDTNVDVYIKAAIDTTWVPLDETALTKRLGQRRLGVRVVLRRSNPNASLPLLTGIRIGYKLLPVTRLLVDMPLVQESLTLEEFGIYESFQSQPFALDNTMRNCCTEDWLYNMLNDGTRWKITEVTENKPLGILTSWALTARLIQNWEPASRVPLGDVPSICDIPPKGILSYVNDASTSEAGTGDWKHSQMQVLPNKPADTQQTRKP